MKRLDLIISAIEDSLKDFTTDSYGYDYRGCCGADLDVGHTADCKLAQALAAARELRELEPVDAQAVAREREACAVLVEADGRVHPKAPDAVWAKTVAKLIRARGNHETT